MYINKELIYKSIDYYGKYLPIDKKVSNYIFAGLINKHMSVSNPLSMQMYKEVSKCIDLRFKRTKKGVKVTILK